MSILLIVLAVIQPSPCDAQVIDPYQRLIDPLALARINTPDFSPICLRYGKGGGVPDPTDNGFSTFAQDTGQGFLTHLYVTIRTPDSLTRYHLFIDGKLYRDATVGEFYKLPTGIMRPPLDTAMGEADVCDVQIPYHHGFKINYEASNDANWFNYGWRPLPANASIPPSGNVYDLSTISSQTKAEQVFRNPILLWKDFGGVDSNFELSVVPSQASSCLKIVNSGIARSFRIRPDTCTISLDSVWLNMYWDDETAPSFSTPLLALFGQSFDFRNLFSLPIDFTKADGFEMRFPLPFQRSMRIELVNRSTRAFHFTGGVTWKQQSVDKNEFGYLCSHFSETNPTLWNAPHHVFQSTGRGKFVGLLMGIPHLNSGADYEGDPIFTIDSTDRFNFHYDGLEDYFNGAQYFSNGEFFSPFGGTSNLFANYYRFHYLDEIDFRKSITMTFEHGSSNNCREHYRTLAFWYQHHCSFRTDRDTVQEDEPLLISGGGYQAKAPIAIRLDSMLWFATFADTLGAFNLLIQPPHVRPRYYYLSVNGEQAELPLLVAQHPTIQIITEPKPLRLQTNDTLQIGAEGYAPRDSVWASINGVNAEMHYTIGEDHRLRGLVILPRLATGDYQLELNALSRRTAISDESITISRTLQYEFENIIATDTSNANHRAQLGWLYSGDWSHNEVAEFNPDSTHQVARFQFYLPCSDTFQIMAIATYGKSFGSYDVYLDSGYQTHIDCYRTYDQKPSDSINFGRHALTRGLHEVEFRYVGTSLAGRVGLWADYMRLTPTTSLNRLDTPRPNASLAASLRIHPDPASTDLRISGLGLDQKPMEISVCDETGRTVLKNIAFREEQGEYVLSLQDLSNGSYWLNILSADNTIVSKPFKVLR